MSEPVLDYVRDHWQGENEEFFVYLTDATFRKHFRTYMESQGLCALTYLELQEQFRQMAQQHFEAFQKFRHLDYWLTCGDSAVRLQPRTYEVYMRMRRNEDQ
ncbi:MAG TPA: hypothetical protein VFQ36_25625 [Ktedonobacteraceae bacterium]|nr:hypothetical protein [Ktedonobacteraceae bacterium]